MKTTNFTDRKTSIRFGVLYFVELVFCVALAGCGNEVLRDFDKLEKEALKYGTVSVGAVRVTDYNEAHLLASRKRLRDALENIQNYLINKPITPSQKPTAAIKDPNKVQAPPPSEIETIGLRMAALKFVESELEDINLGILSPIEPHFRRVVVSLDCSAWVRGKAGAALVYIDLYPYNADRWCDEAAKIMTKWWNRKEIKDIDNCKELEGTERYECYWKQVTTKEFEDSFKSLDRSEIMKMPTRQEIDEEHDLNDWVGFCHRWLEKKKLLPHIAHVERMGKAEYLILAEADYSSSKFGIGIEHPAGPSAKWETETRREAKRRMGSLRQLSLTFVAGDRRAGWLFMPGKTTEGKMAPTERRLRMVVDVPKKMEKLTIHVHKVFLGPDLGILPDAAFKEQMANLRQTRDTLIKTNKPSEDGQATESSEWYPSHYRLIKTRMRNLLYQGWAEEIVVNIPKSKK